MNTTLKNLLHSFWLYIAILMMATLGLMVPGSRVRAVSSLCNATQFRNGTAWGARGTINWTNPALNGGAGSYHRVFTLQNTPVRYVGIGWVKDSTTVGPCGSGVDFCGLIEYNNGGPHQHAVSGVSKATHTYSSQYDPNTSKHWFYVDGSNVWNVNSGFSSGNLVGGGGEAYNCVEKFAHTYLYSLYYLKRNADGTFVYMPWDGHSNFEQDAPYYNTNVSATAFYDDP